MGQGLKSAGIRSRGGVRVGAGRKRGEGSTTVRVPNGLLHEVRELIRVYKASSGALNAVGCNEAVSLEQFEEPLVRKTNQSIEAESPVPSSEHTSRDSELAREHGAGGSDTATPRLGNTGITYTVCPDDALIAKQTATRELEPLIPFSNWQKRLHTLKAAPSSLRKLAIKDFGSLEQAAKECLAYDHKSNGIVVFDPVVFATLRLASSGAGI